ncbi:MAG: hypothetical protein P8Y94_04430, partial [Acidobacteriota bacterium]
VEIEVEAAQEEGKDPEEVGAAVQEVGKPARRPPDPVESAFVPNVGTWSRIREESHATSAPAPNVESP